MSDSDLYSDPYARPKLDDQAYTSKPTADAVFWFSVFECTENTAKIDFDRLAALCGYKNANTARTMISYKRRQMRPADTEKMPTVKGVPQGGRLPAIKKESVYVEPLPVVKKESMDPQMLVRNMDGGEVKKKRIKREDDFVGGAPAKKRRE